MILQAKAKLNLFLHVNSRLDNYYHNLQSMIAFADDIYDELIVCEHNHNKVEIIGGEFMKVISNDTTIHQVLEYLPLKNKYYIRLIKNIPVAAGLGGGSCDAAVLINYLLTHENILISKSHLQNICNKIGSDTIPAMQQKTSFFAGIGDEITTIKQIPTIYAVLVNPYIEQSTANIFDDITNKDYVDKINILSQTFNNQKELTAFLSNQTNSLTKVAISRTPIINNIITNIHKSKNCLLARMSGSGATCFGLFATSVDANEAEALFHQIMPNYWVRTTKLV